MPRLWEDNPCDNIIVYANFHGMGINYNNRIGIKYKNHRVQHPYVPMSQKNSVRRHFFKMT
jgi:hypothetical protein